MELTKKLLIILLRLYKGVVTPVLVAVFGGGCVFTPTCSEYAMDSIREYGIFRGVKLSIKRISRCHPGSIAAYDPVPKSLIK